MVLYFSKKENMTLELCWLDEYVGLLLVKVLHIRLY